MQANGSQGFDYPDKNPQAGDCSRAPPVSWLKTAAPSR
jgi:hypothetical protein